MKLARLLTERAVSRASLGEPPAKVVLLLKVGFTLGYDGIACAKPLSLTS